MEWSFYGQSQNEIEKTVPTEISLARRRRRRRRRQSPITPFRVDLI